jgi:hypothetical protein
MNKIEIELVNVKYLMDQLENIHVTQRTSGQNEMLAQLRCRYKELVKQMPSRPDVTPEVQDVE